MNPRTGAPIRTVSVANAETKAGTVSDCAVSAPEHVWVESMLATLPERIVSSLAISTRLSANTMMESPAAKNCPIFFTRTGLPLGSTPHTKPKAPHGTNLDPIRSHGQNVAFGAAQLSELGEQDVEPCTHGLLTLDLRRLDRQGSLTREHDLISGADHHGADHGDDHQLHECEPARVSRLHGFSIR